METDSLTLFARASTWQIIAAVSTIWAVVATFASPFISSRLMSTFQMEQEKRRQKLWVFATLMQDRGSPVSNDAVRCYNLIDALFHDSRTVRDRWGIYFNSLCDQRLSNSNEGSRIREEKRNDLLSAMAVDLGLGDHFDSDDFSRVYMPRGIVEQQELALAQQELLRRDLRERLTQGNLPFGQQ